MSKIFDKPQPYELPSAEEQSMSRLDEWRKTIHYGQVVSGYVQIINGEITARFESEADLKAEEQLIMRRVVRTLEGNTEHHIQLGFGDTINVSHGLDMSDGSTIKLTLDMTEHPQPDGSQAMLVIELYDDQGSSSEVCRIPFRTR